MHYVTVPKRVVPLSYTTGEPIVVTGEPDNAWWMHKFLITFVTSNQTIFGTGRKAFKAAKKIHKLFKDAPDGAVVPVEDADWELGRTAIETLALPQSPMLLSQLDEFMDAWCEAPSEPPAVVPKLEAVS